MSEFDFKTQYDADDLIKIVELLRDPAEGCPWDKIQTHESIRMNFVEETYEVLDAIDLKDSHLMCEELGDVMLQVALHTRMEEEKGTFDFGDVCDGICKKLIARHPHIFQKGCTVSANDVLNGWDALKNKEKGRVTARSDLESVPAALPALMRAGKLQKRAADHGVASPTLFEALQRVSSLAEHTERCAEQERGELLGDLLFAVVQAARAAGVNGENVLDRASDRFTQRVIEAERQQTEQGRALSELTAEETEALWSKAKMCQISEGM